mmetsp:Transcript_107631/g.335613  ORF Transcript_107631/g.335613 Transcript_107631/m.335613 type:complete len:365 (+) Transcript_107631:125-1219(+)
MDGTGLKLLTLVLTFFSGLGGVLLAQGGAESNWKRLFSAANSLAAGVLLAAGLVCMLPDATLALPKGWASIWTGAAILALICVEDAAAAFASMQEDTPDASDAEAPYIPLGNGEKPALLANTLLKPKRRNSLFRPVRYLRTRMRKRSSSRCQDTSQEAPRVEAGAEAGNCAICDCAEPQCGCFKVVRDTSQATVTSEEWSCDAKMIVKGQSVSAVKAICLFVALSFHSVMEGLGVGTSRKMSVLASISAAILAHKALAAFALGNALRQSGQFSRARLLAMALIFSSGTPVGIAFGMISLHVFSGVFVAACTAIAAGTFCQVAMMEIIPLALQRLPGDGLAERLLRLVMLCMGFGVMSVFVMMVG